MQRLELTLAAPAENVALDEALLEWAEDENPEWEFLRLWESPQPVVVVGRSSRVQQEVSEAACRERGIPILRRSSGGAAIVAGPGCLMYAVVLSYKLRPELKDIGRAHSYVLGQLAESLRPMLLNVGTVMHAGTSDLIYVEAGGSPAVRVAGEPPALRKFSGNSLRARRTHLLYHGTLLYDFDLRLIETCLQMPPRQPGYRERRSHADFVMNLPVARQMLANAVNRAWPSERELTDWPASRVADLVASRFGQDHWNFEFR
jgi:lipoate-protein ligase A